MKSPLAKLLIHYRRSAIMEDGETLTQLQLAQLTGKSVRSIQEYESGAKVPPPEFIAMLVVELRLGQERSKRLITLAISQQTREWIDEYTELLLTLMTQMDEA